MFRDRRKRSIAPNVPTSPQITAEKLKRIGARIEASKAKLRELGYRYSRLVERIAREEEWLLQLETRRQRLRGKP